MDPGTEDIFLQYREMAAFQIVAIGVQEWLDSIDLEWRHRDPADRLIVAYAKRRSLPIVTSDGKIRSFYKNVLW